MWNEYTSANLGRVPRCAGVYLVRSKAKGRVIYVGEADHDMRRTISATLAAIVGERGLSPDNTSDPAITHDHRYQHNQTDLQFLHIDQHNFSDLQFRYIARGGNTPRLDIDALAAFLIVRLRPDYNDHGLRERLSRRVPSGFALETCPCCGRPW